MIRVQVEIYHYSAFVYCVHNKRTRYDENRQRSVGFSITLQVTFSASHTTSQLNITHSTSSLRAREKVKPVYRKENKKKSYILPY
jgi:hypothetical protein